MTENVTIYIDWVQRFNYSKANDSISFISPESAANNTYAQILVSDAMGVESVTPDRLYYSDKVRASKARVCHLAHHERCHDLAVIRFASDSCCRFAVRRRRGLWGRAGLRAVPRGLRPSRRSAPPLFTCIFNGVSFCRVLFVLEATVAGPSQGTGTKEMYAFTESSSSMALCME